MQQEDIINRFTYHPPKPEQIEDYSDIRAFAMNFARFINNRTPVSREQSLSITALEECVFWANAAIARW